MLRLCAHVYFLIGFRNRLVRGADPLGLGLLDVRASRPRDARTALGWSQPTWNKRKTCDAETAVVPAGPVDRLVGLPIGVTSSSRVCTSWPRVND